jgi:hypothetical protein
VEALVVSIDLAALAPSLVVIAGGFVIGLLVGMTGVGAGALTTPMLIQVVGMPPALAVGTDLMFAAITKSSAAWRHHRLANVDWPILLWLALGSIPGTLVVLAWFYLASPDTALMASIVRHVLSWTLVLSAGAIVICGWLIKTKLEASGDGMKVRPLATVTLGLCLGGLVTLTSVGAGALGVTVMAMLYPALAARRLVGTDIVHAIPLTMVSGLGHVGLGHVDFIVLGTLLLGSIPGIALGSRITGLIPDWLLRLALAIVLLNAAYLLSLKG